MGNCGNKPCGRRNPCRACTQSVVTPACSKVCDFVVDSRCVSMDTNISCAGIVVGDTLNEAVVKLCNASKSVSTYTIESVCYKQVGDSDPYAIEVTITPNFTHTTPVSIQLAMYDLDTDSTYTNAFGNVQSSVTSGDSIILDFFTNGFPYPILVSDPFTFMVVDNLGNYSAEIVIGNDELDKCLTP